MRSAAFLVRSAAMLALLATVDAVAEEPSGAVYFQYCSGAVLRMDPAGAERHYDLSVQQGDGWNPIGHVQLDAEGRFLTRQIGDGGETTFTPHNCEKVPGICAYTETGPDGTVATKNRINGREPDGAWSYSILEDQAGEMVLSVVGKVRYAPDGLAAEDNWTATDGYKKSCALRIEPPAQP